MSTQAPNPNQTPQKAPPQSQAIVKGPQERLNNIKAVFAKNKLAIAEVLPKHLTPERLIRIATSAAQRNPELLDCSVESLVLAVVQAGTLGLEPSTPLGHCYLVPFDNKITKKKEATLIIGYRGLCQLAYQSGDVASVSAEAVHINEPFDIELGTNRRIYHKPVRHGEDPGVVVAFYAVVEFKHGGKDFAYMSKAQVDAIREKTPGRNSDAWVNHYDEQGKKTAIRRLSKTLPMSQDKLAVAAAHDERTTMGETPDYGEILNTIGEEVATEASPAGNGNGGSAPKSRDDALADKLGAGA